MSLSAILQSLPDLLSSGKDIASAGAWGALGVFATAGFRWLTSKSRAEQKNDEVFAKNLLDRCSLLEKDNDRLRHEAISKEEFHDKEVSLKRHEALNAKTCFTYLMMLIKRVDDPPKALQNIISDIDAMRSDLMKREDQERLSLEEFEKTVKNLHVDKSGNHMVSLSYTPNND